MAKGWESKSVAEQIESAGSRTGVPPQQEPDPLQLELLRKKESLLLSRTRILRELDMSQNPRYRTVLNKALADLNAKLSQLDRGAGQRRAAP
jgi:hypothetical protein